MHARTVLSVIAISRLLAIICGLSKAQKQSSHCILANYFEKGTLNRAKKKKNKSTLLLKKC